MSGKQNHYVNEIEVAELHLLVEARDTSIKLIDIRSQAQANRASIPGALNIPFEAIPQYLSECASDRTLVLYCDVGIKSAQACLALSSQGVHNAVNLRGGFNAWKMSGLRVA